MPYINDDYDESSRLRMYLYMVLNFIVSLIIGLILATLVSRQLWVPMATPEEARVQCTSGQPYNVTTREWLQLGTLYLNSHFSRTGQYDIEKRLPVDVIYLLHPITCNGPSIKNFSYLHVEDAIIDKELVITILAKIVLWHNVTRYYYDWCSYGNCLFNDPLDEWWWMWFINWSAGVMGGTVLVWTLLCLLGPLHAWYDNIVIRVVSQRIRTVANRGDCV